MDWTFIQSSSVDESAKKLTDEILKMAEIYIPRKIKENKKSHPWITKQ